MTNEFADGAMTVAEFTKWAGVSRQTFYRLVKDGSINPRKVGTRTLILKSEAEKWLAGLPVGVA